MRCDISGAVISRIERGAARSSTLGRLDRIVEVLGARMVVRVLWQGEELDRLLDRDHARIVNRVLEILEAAGWVALPEVTFQVAGERGSIDILGSAPTTGTVLVVEVKSVVPDIQALLAGIDRKARLAPRIASDHGWIAARVARLLVLPGDRTSRRRVDAFASTFERALPARTTAVRRWLRAPNGSIAGILFLPDLRDTQPRQRVRRHAPRCERDPPRRERDLGGDP